MLWRGVGGRGGRSFGSRRVVIGECMREWSHWLKAMFFIGLNFI